MISFEDFSLLFDSVPGEPEFEILFRDTKKEYMIEKYKYAKIKRWLRRIVRLSL